jgi:hypothetical protein
MDLPKQQTLNGKLANGNVAHVGLGINFETVDKFP